MAFADQCVIAGYLLAMLALAYWLGRRQGSRRDYFLGGRTLPGWTLAISIIATQCSTNSLLGAPAFVGFVAGGGMLWLQYEMAVPLAMGALCLLFLPVHGSGVISIYGFLEQRLGRESRLLAAGCFLVFRGVATGVTAYGVASVIALITGVPFWIAVLMLMGLTIAYDVLGGMRAVVLSDVLQMALLLSAVVLALVMLKNPLGASIDTLGSRLEPLHFAWGLSDGDTYAFWPMLIGGFFLYLAYYGCDQSQAQRLLASADRRTLHQVLLLNGLLRFPLVAAYCTLGLGLAAYAAGHPGFLDGLPTTATGAPNLNLVFPSFVAREFAPGLAGLAIVGLLAAAMSSIDSALNSLSASTLEDFLPSGVRGAGEHRLFLLSKLITLAWGLLIVGFSFSVEAIAPTVLEAINKVGSMANGPLLALFVLAAFAPRRAPRGIFLGFFLGLAGNAYLWICEPGVSWLWWNPAGFFLALTGFALTGAVGVFRSLPWTRPWRTPGVLLVAFVTLLGGLMALQHLAETMP